MLYAENQALIAEAARSGMLVSELLANRRRKLDRLFRTAPRPVSAVADQCNLKPSPPSPAVEAGKQIEAAQLTFRGNLGPIIRETLRKYEITYRDMVSRSREARLCTARQEIAWRARRETDLSYPQIGRMLKREDHTTIISAVQRYEQLRQAAKKGMENSGLHFPKKLWTYIILENDDA